MSAPRKYPDELRERAVRLVIEDGEHGAIAGVADRLDINPETLRNWVKAERRRTEQPEAVNLEAENARLRKALAEAERDREILKATGSHARPLPTRLRSGHRTCWIVTSPLLAPTCGGLPT